MMNRSRYGMCRRCALRMASFSASRAITKIAARAIITRMERTMRYTNFAASLEPPVKMDPKMLAATIAAMAPMAKRTVVESLGSVGPGPGGGTEGRGGADCMGRTLVRL